MTAVTKRRRRRQDWTGYAYVLPPLALYVLVILIPVVGGLIVGLMARYGSPKIRGHGIPEVMESILVGESKIASRVDKPLPPDMDASLPIA